MNTLENFGVPVNGKRSGMLMPKLNHRFRVVFQDIGNDKLQSNLTGQVVSVSRPKLFVTAGGSKSWQDLVLVFRDDATNLASSVIQDQIERQCNENHRFSMLIDTLDGGDRWISEQWSFSDCYFATIDYGEFSYAESNMVTIVATVVSKSMSHNVVTQGSQMIAA